MEQLLLPQLKHCVAQFDFSELFYTLGWDVCDQPAVIEPWRFRVIAQLGAVPVLLCEFAEIPPAAQRNAIAQAVAAQYAVNVLIFCDLSRSQALWRWQYRDKKSAKTLVREHAYYRNQPGDLFVSKIADLAFGFTDFQNGNPTVIDVARKLQKAFDVETVTKKFYEQYQTQRLDFIRHIRGIPHRDEQKHYATLLINRILFVWFLQKKGFLHDGNVNYLPQKLLESRTLFGNDQYYRQILCPLFFQALALPENRRSPEVRKLVGPVPYLNGGLFLPHPIETAHPELHVSDDAFHNLFQLLNQYSWNLDDTPGGQDNEMRPEILGYIFEKFVNQKQFGAYYTPPEITHYLCELTIHQQLLQKVNCPDLPGIPGYQFDSVEEMLLKPDDPLCERILDVLPQIKVIDPACGSGAFLVAALNTFINLYSAVYGRALFAKSEKLKTHLRLIQQRHPSIDYFIRKTIITQNLYGVDIMDEAVEIAKLRLFVSLVACAKNLQELEPLPNIDFNLMPGNSLLGLMNIDDAHFGIAYQKTGQNLFGPGNVATYRNVVNEKQRLLKLYQQTDQLLRTDDPRQNPEPQPPQALLELKQHIEQNRQAANAVLNLILLQNIHHLGVKYEQATWDDEKHALGKPLKRPLNPHDVQNLKPFHWAYEFPDVFEIGGFDVVVGNPPWEKIKPEDKEFFMKISDELTKNSTKITDFVQQKAELLQDPEIRAAYLHYLSQFPHQTAYFRSSPQYLHQSAVVDGKKTGTDPDNYKLFLEQFYNLARDGGSVGIVVPAGLYSDLGTTGLRKLIFDRTRLESMISYENREKIFEGVDSRFKFVLPVMEKGGQTERFRAAFMRTDLQDLNDFRRKKLGMEMRVDFVKRANPETLSVPEIKNETEYRIWEKALRFPFLGDEIPGKWNVKFGREFDMTFDSHLFETSPGEGKLPLYEGKMIHQFDAKWAPDKLKYWIDEKRGRKELLGKKQDTGQVLDYQRYRLAYRAIASGTNSRTWIAAVLPRSIFAGNSIHCEKSGLSGNENLVLAGLANALTVDFLLRTTVSANLSMNFIYQLPIPRLMPGDEGYAELLRGAARLTCVGEEYRALWEEVYPGEEMPAAPGDDERTEIRAELDAWVAKIYGLTYEEFAYVLSTFPNADAGHKKRALEGLERMLGRQE